MARTGVIVAVVGAAEARIAAAIERHPELLVARRCADLAEAVAASEAGAGAAVVVSDQPRLTRDVVARLRATGAIVVGAPTTSEAAEQLSAIGMPTVLAVDAGEDAIAQAVLQGVADRPRTAPPEPPAERTGRVIAVWGPAGSPGRTTLAVTVASEAARAGRSTVLIDADTYGGAVAQALGFTDEAPGVAAAVREAQHGSVDEVIIDRHAQRLGSGLRVLTGITRAERWTEIGASALEEVLRAARSAADVVVVDCGFCLEEDEELQFDTRAPQRNGATLTSLRAADAVVAVGGAEPLGMQRLIHGLEQLEDLVSVTPTVVVNRVRSEVAGPRPGEAVADALARFAGVERTWTVPWDPRACDAAALSGRALTECAPRSKARRAIGRIAQSVMPPEPVRSSPRRPRVVEAGVGH